ncbi:hypothetical protein F4805DRAFT_446146 [Annulohypoxylon moriforme]|nr:hypothetical protein F4805DRAFT_446146 [Annulohypoxylon moriforme]
MTVAEVLRKKNPSTPIDIYVQDPDYSPICKEVLTKFGFQVIDCHGALGFTMIDESTVVLNHNAPIPIREIVADIARPAAMYWKPEIPQEEHDAEPELSGRLRDMDSVRTRRMMTQYNRLVIPGASLSQHPYYDYDSRVRMYDFQTEPFGNSVLYVRKPEFASQPFEPFEPSEPSENSPSSEQCEHSESSSGWCPCRITDCRVS